MYGSNAGLVHRRTTAWGPLPRLALYACGMTLLAALNFARGRISLTSQYCTELRWPCMHHELPRLCRLVPRGIRLAALVTARCMARRVCGFGRLARDPCLLPVTTLRHIILALCMHKSVI